MNPFFASFLDDRLTFGDPVWFWALLVLAPLLWLFADAGRRREQLLSKILAPRLHQQLAGQVSPLKRNLRTLFLLLAIVLSVCALAKPRLGFKDQEIKTRGRDVILAIDTSRSMLSTDTAPTRLGRAKLIAQDLLNLLKGDRVGLIAFAGTAFLQAPLTLDKGAVLGSIEDLDTGTIPKGGTDIASAIRAAIAAFGRGEGVSRVLVLMTDGEDLEQSGVEAAKDAATAGIRIFTIGLGSAAGSLIPFRTEAGRNDFVRDDNGRPVTSKLDEARLKEISTKTGGFYQSYGQDAAKLIYDKGIVPMEAQETGMLSGRKPIERYAWPATGALLLLSLWSLLGEGRRGNGGGKSLLLALVAWFAVAPASLSASGLGDYQKGDFQGALKDFEQRLKSPAAASEIRFDAGAAAYKAGDYKKAAGYFSEAMTSPKPKVREAATYNLANSLVRSGEEAKDSAAKLSDWKNSLQHYDAVLKSSPGNAPAKENRDIVRKLIEDLKKQQEQQKKQEEKKDQKENKDKNQQKNDQSKESGGGQKDQEKKDQKEKDQQQNGQSQDKGNERKEQGKDQQQKSDQQSGDDSKGEKPQGEPSPAPSPSPDQGKEGESQKQDEKNGKEGQPDHQESRSAQQQDQSKSPQGGQPTPAPSPSEKKEGTVGGGEQGEKKDQQQAEAMEAEEGKDGTMSPSQARALLRSVQDEEQHILNQQRRSPDRTSRDW